LIFVNGFEDEFELSEQEEKREAENRSAEAVTVVEGKVGRPLPKEIYEYIERMDEDQIIRAMKGELLRSYVYSFEVQGRKVTGLTYAGVRQAIRSRGHTMIIPCPCCNKAAHIDEDGKLYKALVRMRDLVNNIEVIGAAVCAKELPFAYTIAVNKAERNAMRKILPEKIVVQLIEEYLRQLKVKPAGPTKEELMFAVAPAKEGEDLRFVELADSWEVYPLRYFEREEWRRIHESLAERFDAEWLSAGADSHWLIKKR